MMGSKRAAVLTPLWTAACLLGAPTPRRTQGWSSQERQRHALPKP